MDFSPNDLLDPSAESLVDALESDPFYSAIASDHNADAQERRQRLAQYFSYSLEEAKVLGRTVYLEDKTLGASAWLLPANEQTERAAAARKHEFLRECLGPHGLQTYKAIVSWMAERSAPLVRGTWYLSIVGVAPYAQGLGLGQRLLAPTLAEADQAGAQCYLETFNTRTPILRAARILNPADILGTGHWLRIRTHDEIASFQSAITFRGTASPVCYPHE
jgi:GNAT superfamily N-acetyltransferase